ncbi:MAG: NTP transferase domain-containing protein [Nitrospinaceae bacterium]
MQEKNLAVLILAAGKGTRMKSPLAKVLQPLLGRPLLSYVLETVKSLQPGRLGVIVGYQAEKVKATFAEGGIEFVEQKEQLGTGHAARQAESALENFEGDVLVLCGDMPLIQPETLRRLVRKHREGDAPCTLLTLKTGRGEFKEFGRVLRDAGHAVVRIVENKDASPEEKNIDEYNAGVYCFNKGLFFKALRSIDNNNSQSEYYLTDTVSYMVDHHMKVESIQTRDADEIFGINSQEELKQAERIFLARNQSG